MPKFNKTQAISRLLLLTAKGTTTTEIEWAIPTGQEPPID